ncbi:MAG: class II glutamine amidotransferase [Burkholderiaceae bacterium]|jgi:glutamine amidotransferase|nr:class II glutamine amidotransferase [Burkholderiaceae bacterium]
MCRFLVYRGAPVFLDTLVCAPVRSLLHQSLHSEQAKATTHGDGVGIGWYGERETPGRYREAAPAWSDENLQSLCRTLRSPLFFAHVRAATGTATSRVNCHPFAHGPWLFMHNGQVAGYPRIRRTLEALLPDALYAARAGSTDSELLFLLVLAQMERGLGAVDAVAAALHAVAAQMREAGAIGPLRFAAALSDGRALYAFRTADDQRPPTLYLRERDDGVIVASEPLDTEAGWLPLADGEALVVDDAGWRLQPLPVWQAAPAAAANAMAAQPA